MSANAGAHVTWSLVVRLLRLYAGLVGFGVSLGFMVRADLGLGPWDVLHQGIARHLGLQIGWVTIAVSALVLLAWIPLRQRPGLGTVSNVVLVGLTVNATLDVMPAVSTLPTRITLLAVGTLLNALSTGLYIGAGLGPGPRDGLMTGLAACGYSVRAARTAIELVALLLGALLGGAVGIGTVVYALGIGPLVHYTLPRLSARHPTKERPTKERPTKERPTKERPTKERPTKERPTKEPACTAC